MKESCPLCIFKDEVDELKPGMTITINCLVFHICKNCERLFKHANVRFTEIDTKLVKLYQSCRAEYSVKRYRILMQLKEDKMSRLLKEYDVSV